MKKFWMAVSVGSVFAVCGFAETMTGTITDASCGAKHESASAADTACVQRCLKRGSAAVFVTGGKVYQVTAETREKVLELAGQKVTINGKVDGDKLAVETIEAAK